MNAAPEIADKVTYVSSNGHRLSFDHAVLIHVLRGWRLAMYAVTPDSCPPRGQESDVMLTTVAGHRYAGHVLAEQVTDGGDCVLLVGVGELRLMMPAEPV